MPNKKGQFGEQDDDNSRKIKETDESKNENDV